jgi:hypothetical protein
MTQHRTKDIEILIEELTKDHPDQSHVKTLMSKLDLEYSDDPIRVMNTVLMALHPAVQEIEL